MEEPGSSPDDAVLFFGVSLVLGIGCRHLLRGTRVPYTAALLVLGVSLGGLEYGTKHGLGKLGAGIRIWAAINPDLLLAVFLPALLFESSFSMEVHQIKKCMAQMLLLAVPGVVISTFLLGTAVKLTLPYGWNWETSFLFGGLLSATDPVAVVALLKDLGASKKLSTIIEGESLMNDGTAIVVYQLFYRMVLGRTFDAGSILKFLSEVSFGAVALGLAFGIASVLWQSFIFNDTIIEISLTLAASYIAFFTAQDALEVSGVLAVMTLGMFYAGFAKACFKGDGQQILHHFWEIVAYIANTLIFILSGVIIADGVLQDNIHFERHGTPWGFLLLLYVYVQISRALVVIVLYPLLRHFGYGMDVKEAIVLVWSGLRGAVALSLSLSVKHASDAVQPYLKPEVGTMFVFLTGGIMFLTLTINGSTTQFLLHLLGLGKLTTTKLGVLKYTRYGMLKKAFEAFGDLRDDEELGTVDWITVKRYITCLSNLEDVRAHPHDVPDKDDHTHTMNLLDTRVRLLNGVQAAYWGMLEEGRITQSTTTILMRSVDEAKDLVSSQPLCDWTVLRSNVQFSNYYSFLQMSRLPQRLITYFTIERLELGCYTCAAFLHAHKTARRQLHDFLGESEIARIVIDESTVAGEEAKKFLEDLRVAFPQVLRALMTRQVTYAVLTQLSEYIQDLRKTGLLEAEEMVHLDDALQTDLKKLKRNPPMVKMPRVSELLNSHPLVGALPFAVRGPLLSNAKETIKGHGQILYSEGSRPTGIWLVSAGIVKWTSPRLSSRHSVDPILSHGSTLGLYEALTGKPYICDIITESVVHCFFIEAEKVEQLRQSDPSVEGFMWKESTLVIARIFLPRIFEKMAVHEMRVLLSERSSMNIYTNGEDIELGKNYIGILLEGFLKTRNQHLITPPAVLLPSNTDLNLFGLQSSAMNHIDYCYTAPSYQVEARATAILFEIGRPDIEADLQTSASLLSLSPTQGPPPTQSKEHMDDMHGAQRRPSLHHAEANHKNIASYPKAPSRMASSTQLPLLSVRSEGSNATMNTTSALSPALAPFPPLAAARQRRVVVAEDDNSSDESVGEEVIVRVDSPSMLSFHLTSSLPPWSD
ncbi:sodium/hydrogen exchanger 8-like isoform X1 [Triticum urartu]|uniref:sodium/hydrogen exchanger 8-like isoform X1 n=2 Tax=Triticum urartu TaxID=4572 RepID=UPI002043A165|nr:sodium/hydrogen exchanger 8-like isoform X1 [Triticum urartu]